ncbi:MAG: leucyl/phenylalanyl-tRNA--protein transferase [Candidatus Pacebacteria bacterium]|nr:leucyl/phenylalanyl-tRNA--protein transferase [Candidatus Paceibacterota bacterium]
MSARTTLTVETLLFAYSQGFFPMAEGRDSDSVFWFDPDQRGILPLDSFYVPKRLRQIMRNQPYQLRINSQFDQVVRLCGESAPDRPETWINPQIAEVYGQLHLRGHAHSVESWLDGQLVGGLYGVSLGGAFFGESMFSRATDASKIALVQLVRLLREGGFVLLDSQFLTDHLAQFGATQVPRVEYRELLKQALQIKARFIGDLR